MAFILNYICVSIAIAAGECNCQLAPPVAICRFLGYSIMFDPSVILTESMIVGFLEANDECIVDLNLLIDIGVYSRKDVAVRSLRKNFEEGMDYSTLKRRSSQSIDYLLTSDCFKQMCMMAETDFGREVRKYYLEIERRWRKACQQSSQAPRFYQRLVLFHKRTGKIPTGYFCVFSETAELVGQLETHGYTIPDHLTIDISIGSCWCNYMRKVLKVEPKQVCRKYDHWYPGQPYPVKAYIYPLQLLPDFREWFDVTYCHNQLLHYLKKNDPSALPAVNRFLGLLESGED